MSLMPTSRLISDSIRSPAVPNTTQVSPISTPNHHGSFSTRLPSTAPTIAANTAEPARPSQVFLGLMLGAIACLPRVAPTA